MTGSRQLVVTDRDRRLLELVGRFRLLSRDQIMRVAPFRSLTRANTRLAVLVRERLLSRKLMPWRPGNGGAQAMYFLGPAAGEHLKIDPGDLARQMRQVRRWDMRHVAHVLAANQVLVAFLQAIDCVPGVRLLAFRTEPELRQALVDQAIVPDGWVAWAQDGRRFNCFLEVDLHHEGLTQWRSKVVNYLAYLDAGLHQERFGFRAFRVLVTAKSQARQNSLRKSAETAGCMFLFAPLAAATPDAFLGPLWLPAAPGQAVRLAEA